MKKLLLLVIIIGLAVLGYNVYSWKEKPITPQKEVKQTLSVDQKVNLIKSHRIGLNWEDKNYEGLQAYHPGYLRSSINPDHAAEFVAVTKSLNATPWMVISSELNNDDYYSLGHYLKDENLNHVIVEVENTDPEKVENAFRFLTDGAGKEIQVKKVMKTPDLENDQVLMTVENVPSVDYLLVNSNENLKKISHTLRGINKKIAVQEENISGYQLGKLWIEQLSLKVQPQIVSIKENNNALALQMMNKAILGSAHKIHTSQNNPNITGIAFKTTSKWTAALFNDSDKDEHIDLQFPNDNRLLPHLLLSLNEEPKIKKSFTDCCKGRVVSFTIPAHSFVVLPPQNNLTETNMKTEDG